MPDLTIYTTPDCPGCRLTKQMFDRAGVEYQAVDLATRPDLVARFRAEGLLSAPIVEHDGQRTAGFNPARVRSILDATRAPQGAQQTPPAPRPTTSPAPAPGRGRSL